MILKKPYRLLIRYFKLIHIIMFIVFIYLAFILRKISAFFVDYVKLGNFIYSDNMVVKYVPLYVFVLVIMVLIGTIFIYMLMKKKNKPIIYYRGLIGYSVLLLAFFVYYYFFFLNTAELTYDPLKIVINRDITTIIYFFNYFYIGFSFIRGFGFDIRKFNFEQDKKEFEVEESDSEEFEVKLELDKQDINAKLKRQRRETGYFIRENAKLVTIISLLLIISLGGYIYLNFFVKNKVYQENDTIEIANVFYKVNCSYLTNYDKYGDSINNHFVLINVMIHNKGEDIVFTREKFRINISDKYYYPSYYSYVYFDDLGDFYDNDTIIKKGEKNNYLLVFDIKDKSDEKIYFEVLNENNSSQKVKVLLSPLGDRVSTNYYLLNEEMLINNVSLKINSVNILEKTKYEYKECKNGICNHYIKTIMPNFQDVVLIININNAQELDDDFWEKSLGIRYDNKNVSSKDVKLLGRVDNTLYFGVPKSVLNAEYIYAIIKMRNIEYDILLRG